MTRHDKLVRDRIPEIIERAGRRPAYRVLDAAGFRTALLLKLIEEAREVCAAGESDRLLEFADLAEVFEAALAACGFTPEDLISTREARRTERGGFERRIFLESVEG